MKLLLKDLKKGIVKAVPVNQDDLWLLSEVISAGALVSSKTTRKIKLSETKVEKKTYYLTILAEKISYENDVLRVSGKVESEIEDIPKGSSHSINIAVNDDIKIQQHWLNYQIEKIEDSTKDRSSILLVVLDREDVYFAKLASHGFKILSSFQGEVERKYHGASSKGNFYHDVEQKIKEYDERFSLDRIIIGSPAFFKEDFINQVKNAEIKKKMILATCSSVDESAFNELIKRDEVKQALSKERAKDEFEIVDRLFAEISKQGKCTYGFDYVREKAESGAVEVLLVTTGIIKQHRENESFEKLESLMKLVEQSNGKVIIITSSNDAGKRLDGIAGIGAILRYKC
ncbi:MAG: mRNA surveillance protein pelota [Candidatus Woesearchaeota archaeon]